MIGNPRPARAQFLWVTDPWPDLDHPRDTTLRLIEEALLLGYPCHWCDVRDIRWQDGATLLDACAVESAGSDRSQSAFGFSEPAAMDVRDFASVQYRVDPPVNLKYLHPLQLLLMGLEQGGCSTEIVNPPGVLLRASEKLDAGLVAGCTPPTVAASRWETLRSFGCSEKLTVLKPLHNAQGRGVELLDWSTVPGVERARELLQAATEGFSQPVVLQRFLEGIRNGETRLWFLDGDLLAHARKMPKPGQFRIDIDKGDRVLPARLGPDEERVAALVGGRLRACGIRLAAVDLIDGLVTDYNFTSPGLLTELERIWGRNLARPIVTALAKRPAR